MVTQTCTTCLPQYTLVPAPNLKKHVEESLNYLYELSESQALVELCLEQATGDDEVQTRIRALLKSYRTIAEMCLNELDYHLKQMEGQGDG